MTDLDIALIAIGELEVKRRKAALLLHARDERIMELERRLLEGGGDDDQADGERE